MNFVLPDYVGIIAGLVLILSIVSNLFSVGLLWNNIKLKFSTMFQGKQAAIVFKKDGSYYLEGQKPSAGFYEGKEGAWQGTYGGVCPGGDYPILLENESLGVCLTGSIASAIQWLKNAGFTTLKEALNQWNTDYHLMREEEIYKLLFSERDKRIAEINADQNFSDSDKLKAIDEVRRTSEERKKIHLMSIEKQAREDLITLKFNYLTPYAFALSEVITWNAQEVGAQNNKNMLKRKELQTRDQCQQENKGVDPFKWLAIISLGIGIPVAVYLLLNATGHVTPCNCNCLASAANATITTLKP